MPDLCRKQRMRFTLFRRFWHAALQLLDYRPNQRCQSFQRAQCKADDRSCSQTASPTYWRGLIISATSHLSKTQPDNLARWLNPTSREQRCFLTAVHACSPSIRAESLGVDAPSRNALGTTCVSRGSRLADARSILTLSSREARLPSYASLHIKPAKPCAPSARFQGVIVLTLATEMVREYLTEWRFLRRHLRSKFAGT